MSWDKKYYENIEKKIGWIIIISSIGSLAFLIGAAYVVIHFVMKLW